MEIIIKPCLKDLIRPLSDLEFSQLEENILRDGCREPLTIWKNSNQNILLDGHNRYKICNKGNSKFQTVFVDKVTINGKILPIDSVERAEVWVGQNQKGRRNMESSDVSSLGARLVPAFAAEAARRQKELAGSRPNTELTLGKKLPKVLEANENKRDEGKAVAQAAKAVGGNRTYVAAAAKAAGYDNKTRTFKKPEVLFTIGSGKDQTKIKDVMKEQRQKTQTIKLAAVIKDNVNKLPEEKAYSIIYADCPWQYDFEESDNRKIENHYPTMDVEEIKKFRVEFANSKRKTINEIAVKDSVLFFWATAPKLREALAVIEAWGFEYKTHAIWDKEKIGMGYWFRGQHELLLVATKGKISPPSEYARVASIIHASRGKHSTKPDKVYEIIEKMYPRSAKVELFARNKRDGWDSLGDQIS